MKTYRALKPMRVGDSVRQVGELVPEAAEWPNLRTYLSSGYLEVEHVPGDDPVSTPNKEEETSDDATGDAGNGEHVEPERVEHTSIVLDGDDGIHDLHVGVEQPIVFEQPAGEPQQPADGLGEPVGGDDGGSAGGSPEEPARGRSDGADRKKRVAEQGTRRTVRVPAKRK